MQTHKIYSHFEHICFYTNAILIFLVMQIILNNMFGPIKKLSFCQMPFVQTFLQGP